MTKRDLRRQVIVLRDQLWEMETRMRALELRLSEHLRDSERHAPRVERALPMIDPDDGALPGSGTVTTSGGAVTIGDVLHNQRIHDGQVRSQVDPLRTWQHSPFVLGWRGAMPEEDDA